MNQLLDKLGLAEIYLQDGAPRAALRCVREAMEIGTGQFALAESEDLGDVSTHLLREMA